LQKTLAGGEDGRVDASFDWLGSALTGSGFDSGGACPEGFRFVAGGAKLLSRPTTI
jgi:hypothetical protein